MEGAHPPCTAAALRRRAPTASPGPDTSRASQLYELDREGAYTADASASIAAPAPSKATDNGCGEAELLDAGWGVVAVSPAGGVSTPAKPASKRDKKKQQQQSLQQLRKAAVEGGPMRARGTPFVDKSSDAGVMGLTLLQARLIQEGVEQHGPEQKAKVAAEAEARRERQAKTARRKRDWVDPELLDVGEGEATEMDLAAGGAQQYFEFNLEADGTTEVVEFDEAGRVKARRAPGTAPAADASGGRRRGRGAADDDDDDDPLAFLADLDADNDAAADDEDDVAAYGRAASGAAAGSRSSGGAAATTTTARTRAAGGRSSAGRYDDVYTEEEETTRGGAGGVGRGGVPMPGQNPLADEEIEWGLDELGPSGRQRPSLMRELGVIKTSKEERERIRKEKEQRKRELQQARAGAKGLKEGAAGRSSSVVGDGEEVDDDEYDSRGASVAWGGSGGASGIDMDEQEALLNRLFKPHKVKALMQHQRAAEEEMAALKKKTTGRAANESRLDSKMRIVGGAVAGKQLVCSQGNTTRPMMEKVRQAIFNMIQSRAGSLNGLPATARWLDCFAGTGSVGLEALSRGVRETHFIELDPWVVRKVLSRNIATCGFQRQAVVHNMKAEDFLRKAIELPRFAGGPFDFLSVCPPYLLVSYPELMDLLDRSPLIHDRSIVFVEYPKQLAHQVPPTIGPLVTVRDRKYGRTFIRVYGPAGGPADSGDEEEEEGEERDEEEGDELLL